MKRLFLVLSAAFITAFGDAHYSAIREGNESYAGGKMEEAEKYYRRAQAEKDSDIARYNLGNIFYRKGEFGKAAGMYASAIKEDSGGLGKKGLFNLGNSLYRQGEMKMGGEGADPSAADDLKKAADAYRRILLENPSDPAAKHNLEMALKKLEEIEKKNQQGGESGEEGKEDKEQEVDKGENDKSGNEEKTTDADAGDKKRDSNGKDNERKEEKADSGPGEERKGKIKPEDVERILQTLAKNEEKVQKELRSRGKVEDREVEKDW